jgi:hypothetical protein
MDTCTCRDGNTCDACKKIEARRLELPDPVEERRKKFRGVSPLRDTYGFLGRLDPPAWSF